MGLIEKLYVQMSALEATVDQGRAEMAINQRELDRVQAELAQVHTHWRRAQRHWCGIRGWEEGAHRHTTTERRHTDTAAAGWPGA